MRQGLQKKNKLTKKQQFRSFGRSSTRYVGTYLIVDVRPNRQESTRLGITVVRRFGKANKRNRFKRQVREAFRLNHTSLREGVDINVRPRYLAHFAKTQNIYDDLVRLIGNSQPAAEESR